MLRHKSTCRCAPAADTDPVVAGGDKEKYTTEIKSPTFSLLSSRHLICPRVVVNLLFIHLKRVALLLSPTARGKDGFCVPGGAAKGEG